MKFKVKSTNEVLTEKVWHEIAYNHPVNASNSTTSSVFVYATNPQQAIDTFMSAAQGKYRGQNGEQSFNRPVADSIRQQYTSALNPTLRATPVSHPTGDKLSRTDRSMRREAHQQLDQAIKAHLQSTSPDSYERVADKKFLIHHHNSRKDESDNNLQRIMIIPYNTKFELGLAHVGHQLIHKITNDCNSRLSGGVYDFEIHDLSTTPATIYYVTITL